VNVTRSRKSPCRWVDFLSVKTPQPVRELAARCLAEASAALCEPVQFEVLPCCEKKMRGGSGSEWTPYCACPLPSICGAPALSWARCVTIGGWSNRILLALKGSACVSRAVSGVFAGHFFSARRGLTFFFQRVKFRLELGWSCARTRKTARETHALPFFLSQGNRSSKQPEV